jgi:hypothetical protein
VYTASEVRDIVSRYIQAHELTLSSDASMIAVDMLLQQSLFKQVPIGNVVPKKDVNQQYVILS